MKSKKQISIVITFLCVAALCCISFMLVGAAQDPDENKPAPIEIATDWTMHASLLSVDGEIQKTFPLTVNGPIVKEDNTTLLDFLIHIPDEAAPEIAWKYEPLDEGHIRPLPWELESEYYVWYYYCFNLDTSKYDCVVFALSAEKQYLIAYWHDGEEYMLVAAADPDVTVSGILEYFSEFIDNYAHPDYTEPFAGQQK